ncbi:MAG: biopolymer transporter Tol, partial [Ignavibacteriaceae bacterium]|nr:biopolymer transporter Tol [Ignavibacteriaceae bacterium]
IQQLGGYFAYRGGEAVFYYIEKKYGKEKIGELINKIKSTGNVDEGFKAAIGIDLKELNERWKKDIKKTFWPDIAKRNDPDEFAKRLTDHREDGGFYNTSPAISPQGDKIAFISNRDYYFDVYIMNATDGKIIKKLVKGNRTNNFEELNILTPGLSWSPDGTRIALSAKSGGYDVIYLIDVDTEDYEVLPVQLDAIESVMWSPDGKNIAFIGQTPRQSDIYLFNLDEKNLTNLTSDLFTDASPAWAPDGKKLYFSSDRTDELTTKVMPDSFKFYNHDYHQLDLYSIDISSKKIDRITDLPLSDETSPVVDAAGEEILYISDANGINNIYKRKVLISDKDTVKTLTEFPAIPVTNSLNGLYQISVSADGKKLVFSSLYQSAFNIFLLTNPFELSPGISQLEPTIYIQNLKNKGSRKGGLFEEKEISETQKDSTKSNDVQFYTGSFVDSSAAPGDSIKVDFHNYVFGDNSKIGGDTINVKDSLFTPTDNLDENGNFKVNRYKITFSPDLIYANAGYSSLYGLLGTTVISFSDILGNHKLIGVTSLQVDLKNSDYGLAYQYLPGRINFGVEGFHTARFIFLSRGNRSNLFRYRNYGAIISASYPLSKFNRFDAGLSWLNVSQENLDSPSEPTDKVNYLIPTLSFVHDNVLWGYTSPADGSRYRFDFMGNPGILGKKNTFYSFLGDYRNYFLFWGDYSFAFRLSGAYSGGLTPQRFFIGGIENWINRNFANTNIPLESAADFAFLTPGLPLRGFDYAQQIGTRYGLMNMELRFPLIRYLVTGALPILFSNILGTAFIDMGSAWTKNEQLQLFNKNENGKIVTKDLLMGTGFGARVYLLYFLVRFDVAWAYNLHHFSQPKFYISLGADF